MNGKTNAKNDDGEMNDRGDNVFVKIDANERGVTARIVWRDGKRRCREKNVKERGVTT